jgi:hypothetical protein
MLWMEWDGHSIHLFNLESKARCTYQLNPPFEIPLFSRTLILPLGGIFLCGGRASQDSYGLRTAWLIDTPQFTWTELDNMKNGHSNHFICLYRDYIFVVAGCDEKNRFTNKCEKFSLITHKWESICSTNEIRDSISGCIDSEANFIYIAGGRIDNGHLARTIERYSIASNFWILLDIELPVAVDMHALFKLPGPGARFILFGGLDEEQNPTNQTCLIDLHAKRAERVTGMQTVGGCIVNEIRVYEGHLYSYIFQGYSSRRFERWSLATEQWEQIVPI